MKSVIIFATFSMFVGLQWLLSRFPPMKGNFTSAWVNHQAPVGAKVMNFVHLCTGDKGKVCGFWRMRVEHVEFTMVLKAEFLGRTIHFQRHWRTFFFLVSWVFSCEHIQFLHVVLLVFTMVTAAGYFCLHCIMFSKTAMLGHSQLSGPLDRHKASQDLPCPC